MARTFKRGNKTIKTVDGWLHLEEGHFKPDIALARFVDLEETTPPPPQRHAPTAEEMEAKAQEQFLNAVKAEVARRILEVVNEAAQLNLLAAKSSGFLTPEQEEVFKAGTLWIGAIRADGARIISDGIQDFYEDEHWTDVPPDVAELAGEF